MIFSCPISGTSRPLTVRTRKGYVLPMFAPVEYTKWTDRLCFDIALKLEGSGEDIPEILSRHGLSPSDLAEFSKDPVFDKKVRHYRDEIREKGITFRLKARAQAEELLTTSWSLIHHPDVSAAVKADLIKSTVKWAGLEVKSDADTGATGGVSITINLGGEQQEMRVVEHEPAE
jgi:hypothetical protein